MLYSVETGKSGFEKALGMPMFDSLAQHPEDATLFSETMIGVHGAEPAAVAAAYDFSELRTIVDVGGATGNLLTTILGSYHVVSSSISRTSFTMLPRRLKPEGWPRASR